MMILRFPVCVLVVLTAVGFLQVTESVAIIKVQPAEINYYGHTGSLEVNCSAIVSENSNMASLCSMIISRSNDSGETFTDLASITDFSPNTFNLATSESILATGIVNKLGESYLHLMWEDPMVHQAGIYRCSAQGVDSFGHAVVSTDTAEVLLEEPDFSDFADKISEMQAYTSGLEQTVVQMSNDLKNYEQTIQRLDNYTQNLETQISNMDTYTKGLEDQIKQLDSYAKNLETTASQIETDKQNRMLSYLFEASSLTYNNHKYYVSKNGFTDIDVAMMACTLVDGYLVEIDDADEFQAVQDFLSGSASGYDKVTIAGSDRATEGRFILPSTQQPIPYTEWGPNNPATDSNAEDCLGVYSGYEWKMYDAPCNYNPPQYGRRYMCEVPLN